MTGGTDRHGSPVWTKGAGAVVLVLASAWAVAALVAAPHRHWGLVGFATAFSAFLTVWGMWLLCRDGGGQ